MALVNISPNMGLPVPVVGSDPGPDWSNNLNASLSILDAHNHSSGSGVQITPNGLNINANLPLNGNSLASVGTVQFTAQLADPSVNDSSYVKGVDLYYKDGNGNVIQITSGGGVVGTPGSISSLASPASATYVAASGTFVWQQNTGVAANMDAASLILRYPGSYPSPSGNYISLQAPSSISSGYSITFPALPASTQALNIGTSGNMGTISYNSIGLGITASGANSIGTVMTSTGANAIAASRTRTVSTSVGIGGVAVSASSGTGYSNATNSFTDVTNLSVTIVTSGRPVMLMLVSADTSGSSGFISASGTDANVGGSILFNRDASTTLSTSEFIITGAAATSKGLAVPPGAFQFVDTTATAASHTYKIRAASLLVVASASMGFSNVKLIAYEL